MRGMRATLARWFVAVTLALGMGLVTVPRASATPNACGWLTVTIDGDPHDVPYLTYCGRPCPGPYANVGHGQVLLVEVDGFLCVRDL